MNKKTFTTMIPIYNTKMYIRLSQLMYILSWTSVVLGSVVFTAQGKVRGLERDGFVSYIGVPYATAGHGGRFKKAGLAPTWSDVRESRDPYCTSRSDVQDCLQLDVHTPRTGAPWPVLVWVKGTSGDYWPEKLVKQGILMVIVRHRLGPVGFMCSEEERIPGNAGAKDVVLALRWVRDNIVAFKGNPHRVVVGGQGFGGAIVEALTLSPMSKDLFHGVIIQSGSILAPWGFSYEAIDNTRYLQMMMNESDVIKSSIGDLVSQTEDLDLPYFPFSMCVERPFKNEEALLTESPFRTLMKGTISTAPMMIGYNTNEAYVFVSILQDMNAIKKMSRDATFLLPMEFQSMGDREIKALMKQATDMYFDDDVTMSLLLDYHRDAYFLSHIHRSAKFHASQGTVYYYQFSHSGHVGVDPDAGLAKSGAAHSDELAYLFPTSNIEFEGDDATVYQHMIQLWSTFVKNLKPESPGVQWERLKPHEPRLLDINTNLGMIDFPYRKQMQMWEDIYEKYYHRKH